MELNMKNFQKSSGGDSPKNVIDIKGLENNPNFKPEGDEGAAKAAEEAQAAADAQAKADADAAQEAQAQADAAKADAAKDKPEGDEGAEALAAQEAAEAKAKADAEAQSSLTENNKPNTPEPNGEVELTDEIVNKYLSEKLDKDFDYNNIPTPTELDPQVKVINDWKEKTGRPIEDFFKYQKDYSEVSDLDIARESLHIEYPTLTPAEIELEMERFIATEDDLENDAAKKNLELKKYAVKGRNVLESLKAELGEASTGNYPTEVKSQLEFAQQVQKQLEDNKANQADYTQGITTASESYDSLTLDLSEDLSIDFKVSDEDKKGIPTLIETMPHWKNEDGSWNHQSVVKDAIIIKNYKKMIKLAYEQGQNSGKDGILKDAKNSTLGKVPNGAEQGTGSKKPIIEGIDKMLQKHQGQKIRFGNKNN